MEKTPHHTSGGRGEFYGGDQILTSGFKKKVVSFTGKGHLLQEEKPRCSLMWKLYVYLERMKRSVAATYGGSYLIYKNGDFMLL
uniref:Uncharacterized protein n=1 Tax=Pithovirus LCPAC304 TaxID=2506594 RepID=A0A481Z716_9VIRU|nr:MAG: hypothetical protein LCPAC304_00090 [Pithovirus LCPAC304]